MSFWSFLRDMFVFDWLFGHHKKTSFDERDQSEQQDFGNTSDLDEYIDRSGSSYNYKDFVQQDFDDDLDEDMFDDDF